MDALNGNTKTRKGTINWLNALHASSYTKIAEIISESSLMGIFNSIQ